MIRIAISGFIASRIKPGIILDYNLDYALNLNAIIQANTVYVPSSASLSQSSAAVCATHCSELSVNYVVRFLEAF